MVCSNSSSTLKKCRKSRMLALGARLGIKIFAPKEFLRLWRNRDEHSEPQATGLAAQKIRDLAQQEGISINQFISTAVAEKMAALMTDYLEERARRGTREKFLAVLAKVPDAAPEPGDEL
jgi:hypothetical protein